MPSTHDTSPLNTPDALPSGPSRSRPGAPCPDAPLGNGYLLDRLRGGFTLLALGRDAPDIPGTTPLSIPDITDALRTRYLGEADSALYLIRPDQHVAARWASPSETDIQFALTRAKGGHA